MELLIDWYNGHWILFSVLSPFILSYILSREAKIVDTVFLYFIFVSLRYGFSGYADAHPTVSTQIKLYSLQGMAQLSVAYFFYKSWDERLEKGMRYLFRGCLVLTILSGVFEQGFSGLGVNPSLNGTLLSLLLPFEIRHHDDRKIMIISGVTLAAISLSGSSMGILAIVGGLVISFVSLKKVSIKMAMLALLALLVIFYLKYGGELWSLTERDKMWKLAFKYMQEQGTWAFGSGYGTFAYLGPKIQQTAGWTDIGYFVHAHSDIIQLFFESGLLGLLVAGTLVAVYSWVAYNNKSVSELYFISAFMISCVGNFPMRLPLTILCLSGMLAKVFRR